MRLYETNPVINLVLFGVKESWKYPDFLWRGREKCKRFFYCLGFCAAPRMSRKTGMERLPYWTGEACPIGEGWSGRVVRLPQALGNINKYKS